MPIQDRLQSLYSRIGAEFKTLRSELGARRKTGVTKVSYVASFHTGDTNYSVQDWGLTLGAVENSTGSGVYTANGFGKDLNDDGFFYLESFAIAVPEDPSDLGFYTNPGKLIVEDSSDAGFFISSASNIIEDSADAGFFTTIIRTMYEDPNDPGTYLTV